MSGTDGVFVTLELKLKPGQMADFAKSLPSVLDETRQFDGFIDIAAYRHESDPDRLVLAERWQSAEAYHAYIAWRVSTGFMDSLAEVLAAPPTVEIWPERIA